MRELIHRPIHLGNETLRYGLFQSCGRVDQPIRVFVDNSEDILVALRPKGRRDPQRLGDVRRKTEQLGSHELHDRIRNIVRSYPFSVPLPPSARQGEAEQALVMEGGQELLDEQGVPPSLLHDEVGQRSRLPREEVEKVREEGIHALPVQVANVDRGDGRVAAADALQPVREGMVRSDLVVAVAHHQQKALDLRVSDECFDDLQGRLVGPLQVVQKEHHGPGSHARRDEQPPDQPGEVVLLRLWRHQRPVRRGGRRPAIAKVVIAGGRGVREEDLAQVWEEVREDSPLLTQASRHSLSQISIRRRAIGGGVSCKNEAVLVQSGCDGREGPHLLHGIEFSRGAARPHLGEAGLGLAYQR
mmetsp:Transcript_41861/g.126942  ORF Transcript_41861/g.126942 Transcript_41861/m.126942 type:complete len:358 (+) Transcript_41861:1843-2916(+)